VNEGQTAEMQLFCKLIASPEDAAKQLSWGCGRGDARGLGIAASIRPFALWQVLIDSEVRKVDALIGQRTRCLDRR
jgi:hypothetical protein